MLASQRGCLQLSWTGQSKTPILKRSKALTELCVTPCLVMSSYEPHNTTPAGHNECVLDSWHGTLLGAWVDTQLLMAEMADLQACIWKL